MPAGFPPGDRLDRDAEQPGKLTLAELGKLAHEFELTARPNAALDVLGRCLAEVLVDLVERVNVFAFPLPCHGVLLENRDDDQIGFDGDGQVRSSLSVSVPPLAFHVSRSAL